MNPLIDYSTKTTEELLELNKRYTKQLYSLSGNHPLYNHILSLRDDAQFEYGERMQMSIHKDKLKGDQTKIINIGEIESISYGYQADDDTLFINAVAETYTKRNTDNENNSS
jgi:hypothetical protein